MFCRKCGKEIADDAKFCRYCGNTISQNEATGPQTPPTDGGAGAGTVSGAATVAPGTAPVSATGSFANGLSTGKATIGIASLATLVVTAVIVICMFLQWVAIPFDGIAEDLSSLTGSSSSASSLEDIGSIGFSIPSLADTAGNMQQLQTLTGSSSSSSEQLLEQFGSAMSNAPALFFLWAIGLVVVVAGATLKFCTGKSTVFIAGCAICAVAAIAVIGGTVSANSQINNAIAELMQSYSSFGSSSSSSTSVNITWVAAAPPVIITLIASIVGVILGIFENKMPNHNG